MCNRDIIIDGWLLAQAGHGMASYAIRLAKALAKSRLASRIVVVVPENAKHCVPVGLHSLVLKNPFCMHPALAEFVWQNRLGGYVRRHYPDAVFLALSPFYSWNWPNRSVVVWHDLIPLQFKRYMGRFLFRRFILMARLRRVRKTSMVITDSRFTASALARYQGTLPPLETIGIWPSPGSGDNRSPGAIDAVRTKYGLPQRYWLYVGGYDYRKNVECLIEAYGRASDMCECPALVLAGKIPDDLRKPVCNIHSAMGKIKLAARQVCLPGFIDSVDMESLYCGAELFVYPSLAEGFGLPPLEAMACGCPAIVADTTSLPEVVVDAGYRFSPHPPESLAVLLAKAAKTPLPMNPGFNRDNFSEKRGMEQYCAVLERVSS